MPPAHRGHFRLVSTSLPRRSPHWRSLPKTWQDERALAALRKQRMHTSVMWPYRLRQSIPTMPGP